MTQLNIPPDWEYQSTGPWAVCAVQVGGVGQIRVLHALQSAVHLFWLDNTLAERRVMVDAAGHTILAVTWEPDCVPSMVGTEQVLTETVSLMERNAASVTFEERVEVIALVERMREMRGVAL